MGNIRLITLKLTIDIREWRTQNIEYKRMWIKPSNTEIENYLKFPTKL